MNQVRIGPGVSRIAQSADVMEHSFFDLHRRVVVRPASQFIGQRSQSVQFVGLVEVHPRESPSVAANVVNLDYLILK